MGGAEEWGGGPLGPQGLGPRGNKAELKELNFSSEGEREESSLVLSFSLYPSPQGELKEVNFPGEPVPEKGRKEKQQTIGGNRIRKGDPTQNPLLFRIFHQLGSPRMTHPAHRDSLEITADSAVGLPGF